MTQIFCFISYTVRKQKNNKTTLNVVLVYYLKKKKNLVHWWVVCLPDNPELRPLLLEFNRIFRVLINRIAYRTSMLPSFGSLYSNYSFLKLDSESTSCQLYNLLQKNFNALLVWSWAWCYNLKGTCFKEKQNWIQILVHSFARYMARQITYEFQTPHSKK